MACAHGLGTTFNSTGDPIFLDSFWLPENFIRFSGNNGVMPRRLAPPGYHPDFGELLDHRIVDRRRRGDHAPGWNTFDVASHFVAQSFVPVFCTRQSISAVSSAGWKNEEFEWNGFGTLQMEPLIE